MRVAHTRVALVRTLQSSRLLAVAVVSALVLSALLAPASAWAKPTADQVITSENPPPLITVVCAAKVSGKLRAPASGRCRPGEKRTKVTVGKPLAVCRTSSRALFVLGPGKRLSRAECRRTGAPVTVPGTIRVLVCRAPGGAIRWITGSQSCRRAETLVRFRNSRPYQLTLSNDLVTDRAAAGTLVGTFTARDRNGETLTWRLVPGAGAQHNASFRISGNRLLTTRAVNARVQRSYSLRVEGRDRGGRLRTKVFTVQVAPLAATAVTLTPGAIQENATGSVGRLATLPAVLTGTSYTLVSGTGDRDNAAFTIAGTELRLTAPADHESRNGVRLVRVRSTDDRGVQVESALQVQITDVNEAPTALHLDHTSVAEHAAAGTVVGELSVTDPDAGERFTWQVDPSADVEVVGSQLRTRRPLSHRDSPLTVRLTATDRGGLSVSESVDLTVLDVADAPTDLVLSNDEVAEFAPAGPVGTLSATHDDGSAGLVYALASGAGDDDNAAFTLTGDELSTRAPLRQSDGLTRSIRVRVSAPDGGEHVEQLTVRVLRTPTAPHDLTLSPSRIEENAPAGTVVGTLSATDPNRNETRTWSLVSGTGDDDNAAFEVRGDTLVAVRSFDHEESDTRTVRVQVRDADGLTTQAAFTVSVTDVDEAPVQVRLSANEVTEGRADAEVGQLSAQDPEGTAVRFSLASGQDSAQFRLDGSTLRTAGALDFAAGATRILTVVATDAGGTSTSEEVTIRVLKDPKAPTGLDLSATEVAENSPAGTVVGTLSTTDPNAGDEHTYTLLEGGDHFALDGATLVVKGALDHEAAATREVRIRTTDPDGASFERTFTVRVLDVNEAPHTVVLSNDVAVSGAANVAVGQFSATDPDAGDTLTWALVPGQDAASFVLSSAGALRTNGALDRADGATRTVTVSATDAGGLSASRQVTIRVEIVESAPYDLTLSNRSVAENEPVGSTVGRLQALDVNSNDTHTYTLLPGPGGEDNASFSIANNVLQTAKSFDYETKNVLRVLVRATDQTGRSFDKAFLISVTDVDEAPTGLTISRQSVAENSPVGTVVGVLSATDPENGLLLWTGASAPFTIVGNELRVSGPLDFETRSTHPVTVQVSDGTNAVPWTVQITVTDVNEAPTAIALSRRDLDENNTVNAVVGTLSASDPDAGETFTWTVLSGPFTVSGGSLRASQVFDHEATPTQQVRLRVTDRGGLTFEQTFTVTVNDVNEAPVVGTDSWSGLVGNVPARVASSAPAASAHTHYLGSALLTANDTDPEGDTLTAVPATVTTARNGTVVITSDGAFTYTPPVGLKNTNDSFTYQVTDGTLSSTGTVTLTVGARRIWFVDAAAAAPGLGTVGSPFASANSLATAIGANGPGDEVRLASGTHTVSGPGLVLATGLQVYGGPAEVTVGSQTLFAPEGASTLQSAGTAPVMTLATDVSVRHLTIEATGSGSAVVATNVDRATVANNVTISSTTGSALLVTGGSGLMTLAGAVQVGPTAQGTDGVRIAQRSGTTVLGAVTTRSGITSAGVVLNTAGTVQVTGQLTLRTGARDGFTATNTTVKDESAGHSAVTTTGVPVRVTNGSLNGPFSWTRLASVGAPHGLVVSGTTGAPVVVVSPDGAPSTVVASTDVGILVENAAAPSLRNVQVSGGAGDGIRITDSSGVFNLTDSTVQGNAQDQVQVALGNAAADPITIDNNQIGGGQHGVVLTRDGSAWQGDTRFSLVYNTVSGSRGAAMLIAATGMPSAGGFNGIVRGNTIGTELTNSCSTTGNGIEVANEEGAGQMRIAITRNAVTQCRLKGIQVLTGAGNAGVSATIADNVVSGSSDTTEGHALDLRVGTLTTDNGTSCLDVKDNTLTSAGTLPGVILASKGGTTQLPAYTGGLADGGAVETYLRARNPAAGSVKVTPPASGQGFTSGTCAQP